MRLRFTKMHGAGNDFVVIDATREPFSLTREQMRRLGDRRFGVGCDQILVIEPGSDAGADFRYRIFNNTGDEVEHCGNGARCFVRFVVDAALTDKREIRVDTMNRRLLLKLQDDGRVTVDMGAPVFEHAALPFDASGLKPRLVNGFELWPLDELQGAEVAVLSMGNPHAVQRVDDVETAPVLTQGPLIERHARFAKRVNAGFMQVLARDRIALRVYERDAGETLACGTGACAAVVAGIRAGWLDGAVEVQTRGGLLKIEWAGGQSPVLMTGPATKVFDGEIAL
ncbi:diaminopimelate epimerase [Pelomonas aquatica]|jgi:diaminopimelate epimerase|uniref:Diaminopimelate epimerase n=1 Tax=Pelomonas aquatica TaxID=431058 RepID=A0A9X4R589_9BURK|nr:diaminopimelate epimerase [Pelomonas aquatica]MCY4756042.1 diaminopimelate epimerase [Pelomonas aquatica]MDG0864102.1 diaminopimelate epimerase [Pelomonas aquatica]